MQLNTKRCIELTVLSDILIIFSHVQATELTHFPKISKSISLRNSHQENNTPLIWKYKIRLMVTFILVNERFHNSYSFLISKIRERRVYWLTSDSKAHTGSSHRAHDCGDSQTELLTQSSWLGIQKYTAWAKLRYPVSYQNRGTCTVSLICRRYGTGSRSPLAFVHAAHQDSWNMCTYVGTYQALFYLE